MPQPSPSTLGFILQPVTIHSHPWTGSQESKKLQLQNQIHLQEVQKPFFLPLSSSVPLNEPWMIRSVLPLSKNLLRLEVQKGRFIYPLLFTLPGLYSRISRIKPSRQPTNPLVTLELILVVQHGSG